MSDLRQALHKVLPLRFGISRDGLSDDTPLFSSGAIDSMQVIALVTFVEETIENAVPPEDITLDNFDTIARIVAYARSRGSEPSS